MTRPPRTDATTVHIVHPDRTRVRRVPLRRLGIALASVAVLAGLLDLLGVETRQVSARAGGYVLTQSFPARARPALAVEWKATVTRAGGFDAPVTLAVPMRYLDLFDINTLTPSPAAQTAGGGFLLMEFDPPDGDTLTVSLDARIEPARQTGEAGRTELRVAGRTIAAVGYRTRIYP